MQRYENGPKNEAQKCKNGPIIELQKHNNKSTKGQERFKKSKKTQESLE